MSLGTNNATCKTEFKEAMRPIAGANVDRPDVDPNFGALGQAVFRIATIHAETNSDPSLDPAFWQWVSETNVWLQSLSTWQRGVAQAFTNWAPTQLAEQNLKAALTAVPQPGNPPSTAPNVLRGEIQ
ncbi:hypothetical protein ACKFKG_30145 [Phormidesmis sp. 146-35]